MIKMSLMYLKYWISFGRMYFKGWDSKNSRQRQARTPLKEDPMGRPNFSWLLYLKKYWLLHNSIILMRQRCFLIFSWWIFSWRIHFYWVCLYIKIECQD